MISFEHEMTYRETIEGPLATVPGSPFGDRLCWKVTTATLVGPRINATLAMPGTDWMRLGSDGIRRQDLRVQFTTDDHEVILMHYDLGLIRPTEAFLQALSDGTATSWPDQYMRMVPEFVVGKGKYSWLDENLFLAEGRLSGPHEIEYAVYRVL
jgi:hypothetical protein